MAAPPPVFSDLFNDPTKWDEPAPDYGALITLMGGCSMVQSRAFLWCVMLKLSKSTRRGLPRQAESTPRSVDELKIFVLTLLLEATFVLSIGTLLIDSSLMPHRY